jgi:hypothetical protein
MRRVMMAAAVTAFGIFAAVMVRPVAAQQPVATPDGPVDPIVAKWDKGPDKIDISKYPADMKKRYKTFTELCSKCHTLARAINCDFVLDDEWERYIKKMMRRSKGGIPPEQALEIFQFASYDSRTRKHDLFERKMAALK